MIFYFVQEKADANKEEQQLYGITYDDDYDYMQHLRSLDEMTNVEPVECIRIPAAHKPKKAKVSKNLNHGNAQPCTIHLCKTSS